MARKFEERITWSMVTGLVREAARLRGLEPWQVMHVTHKRAPAHARFGVMWVLRQFGFVLTDIANQLGLRDYTSVMHGVATAEHLREADPEYDKFLEDLFYECKGLDGQDWSDAGEPDVFRGWRVRNETDQEAA